ncbi:GntR family transcriptional regulator [Virgibacillus sp. W0430]|uniref:GntR family transcriptional regulator n=1 Tax=Virgibacillus sp. W0430 TaxID=3391580 RepID=UPI003F462F84
MNNNEFTKLIDEKNDRIQTTQEWVTNILRQAILNGYYSDGKPLETTILAEKLGVSRMPIRTALLQLENEGLVVLEPHKKAVATKLSPKEVHQLCEIRRELEALSVRYVIENIQDCDFKELDRLVDKMDNASASDFMLYNREFHKRLNQISRNKTLENMILQLRNNVDRYLRLYVSSGNTKEKIQKGNKDHRDIIKAVKEKDSPMAEKIVKEHLSRTCDEVAKLLENISHDKLTEKKQ